MSNNGDKSKKPANSFALLSQKMNEVQKTKKPNQVTSLKSITKKENSPANLTRSSSTTTIDLDEDIMSPKRSESQSDDRDPNVPDRSYGDYFCPLCDSHMNSDAMWIAHISGKRHLKNVDKGSKDPKYDDLDVESCIKQEIKNVKDPVIGLSYIHEIRRKENTAPPIFTCFLCQATFPTAPLTIEHVLTMKHRMNFMKENSPDDYQLLEATNLKKGHMEPLVEEMTLKLEQKYGRGSVKVKQEKHKTPPSYTYSSKRSLGTDDEEEKHPRKHLKPDDKDFVKDAHFSKNKKENAFERDKYGRDVDRRRRHSSSGDEDSYKRHSSPPRNQKDRNPIYPKRYDSSYSHDSYRKDSFFPRKSVSPMRSFHHRSPPPREPIKDNYKIPYGPEPPPFYSSSSLQFKERTPISSYPHPSPAENRDDSQILKDFVQKIFALPPEIFFKIVLLKLENLDMKCVEELTLISKVIQKAQEVLCKKLPPEIQAVINQKLSQNSGNMPNIPQSSLNQLPQSSLPNRLSQSGDFSFIKEFLDHKKSPSVVSSPVPPAVAPPVGAGAGIPPHNTPSSQPYGSSTQAYGSSSQTYGNSNQTYGNSSQTYRNQSTKTYQSSDPPAQNYAPSYQNSYNNTTSSNSSGIPGLTLAEENRDRQNYSYGIPPNQSSHYPSYGY